MRRYNCARRVFWDVCWRHGPGSKVLFILFLLAGILSGAGAGAVRLVEVGRNADCSELAERARRVGDEACPRVRALLSDGQTWLPAQFEIEFKREMKVPDPDEPADVFGYVKGRRGTVICLNAGWLTEHPTDLEAILVHEMVHVAQRYSSAAPSYWAEGMADYVCFRLGYTNGGKCPECSNVSWHYRSGYSCAAAFLLYVDAAFGGNVIRELNIRLRAKSYSDTFFATATGKSLEELWTEFQKTPAFTPGAAGANKFFESLGFVNGRAPKGVDVLTRIRKQPGGELTSEAGRFLYDLAKKRKLPGFRKGESGDVVFAVATLNEPGSDVYPVSRTFDSSVQGRSAVYHYLVVRASRHGAWRLQRAWRTNRDGLTIEEYPVP